MSIRRKSLNYYLWNLENEVRHIPVRKQIKDGCIEAGGEKSCVGQSELRLQGMESSAGVLVFILALYFPQGFWHIKANNLGHVLQLINTNCHCGSNRGRQRIVGQHYLF